MLEIDKYLNNLSLGKKPSADVVEKVFRALESFLVLYQLDERDKELQPQASVPSFEEAYGALLFLGKIGFVKAKGVVESLLSVKDPLIVSLALETLCTKWKLTNDYLERLASFMLGEPWDKEEDVRKTAIRIVRDFALEQSCSAKEPFNTECLDFISLKLSIFRDPQASYETRRIAYYSLLLLSGQSWDQVPSDCLPLDFGLDSKDINWGALSKLEKICAERLVGNAA